MNFVILAKYHKLGKCWSDAYDSMVPDVLKMTLWSNLKPVQSNVAVFNYLIALSTKLLTLYQVLFIV